MPKREVQRRIDKNSNAASGGVVYGSGLPSTGNLPVHDLAGPAHYGFLSSSQAPQFPLLDGTRPYTGDINLSGHNIINVALIDGFSLYTFDTRITTLESRRVLGGNGLSDSGNTLGQGDITLNVNAGYGITLGGQTVTADAVNIDRTFPFNWLAMHTFSAYLQTERVYALADLTLIPNTDLLLDPTSDIIKVMPNTTLKSSQAVSGQLGWQINWDGDADFRDIFADSLTVETFIADVNLALAGSQIIGKSLGTLSRNFTVPAAVNQSATLYVYDLPGLQDTQVFEAGDWIRLRYIDRSNGGLRVGNAWGTVTNYADLANGEQSWTFTYKGGSNASTGQTIFAGMVALDYGTSGSGQWHVTTLELDSPYWEISTWSDSDPMSAANFTVWTRGGQLKGITSVDEWGIWAGNTVTDKWVKAGSNGVTLHNADLSIINGNFYAGNANQTQYVSWNGTNLVIRGNLLLPTGETVVGPGMTWRGTWATGTAYNKYDAVVYNGRSYVTSATHTSTPTGTNGPPGTGIYWTLIADQGATGPQGSTGPQGPQGPTGPQGPSGPAGADNQDFPFLIAAELSIDPAYNGLMVTAEKMGYVASGHFKTYMDNAGNFVFGTGATNRLFWNQSTGKLGGVNSTNTTQWYASAADGKIYAGVDQVVLSAYGLDLGIYTGRPNPTDNVKAVAFWSTPGTDPVSSTPIARVYGGLGGSGSTNFYLQLEAGTGSGDPKLWIEKDAAGIGSHVWISNAKLLVSNAVTLFSGGRSAGTWEVQSNLVPVTTLTSDIGTPSLYFRSIYVDQLVTNTIVGTPLQSHMHDDRYYTKTQADADYAPLLHTHSYLSSAGGTMTGGLVISTGVSLPLALVTSSATPWSLTLTRSDLSNSSSVRNTGSAWSFEHTPKVGSSAIWHAGNDGTGSGMDADMVDGLHAAAFGLLTGNNIWTGGNKMVLQNAVDGGAANGIFFWQSSNSTYGLYMASAGASRSLAAATSVAGIDARTGYAVRLRVANSASDIGFLVENASEQALFQVQPNTGNVYVRGQMYAGNSTANTVWHAGNDGTGSGMDADMVDGFHETTFMRKSANSDLNMNNFNILTVGNIDATTGVFDSAANPALTVGNSATGYLKIGAGVLYDEGNNLTYNGPRSFYVAAGAPNTYIYSANIYLGNTSGTAIHLRSNDLDSDNADLDYLFGRGQIGFIGHNSFFGFAHRDNASQTNYAFLQGGAAAGSNTFINAPANQFVYHRIANNDVMVMDVNRLNPAGSILKDLGDYNRKWRTLFAGELYVETLVAQKVMATIGGRITVAPTSKLIADVTNVQTTIDLADNSFFNGDYIYLMTAPGGIQQIEAMQVFGVPLAITGGYRYTVVRDKDGTGANSWVTGDAVISLAGGGALIGSLLAQMTNTQCTLDVNTTLNHGTFYFLLTQSAYEVVLVVNNGVSITGGFRYNVVRNAQNGASGNILNAMTTASQTTIDVTTNTFVSGDYVNIWVNGIPVTEMFRIASSASVIAGGYRYTIARAQSGTAQAWSAGAYLYRSTWTWAATSTLHNYTQRTGRGYIDLTSTSTIHNHLGPTLAIYSRTWFNNWNDVKPVVAMGNLRSFVDYSADSFGWAAGNDLTLTPTTGFKGMTGDETNGLRLFNVSQDFYENGTRFLHIDPVSGIDITSNSFGANDNRALTWKDSVGNVQAFMKYITPGTFLLSLPALAGNASLMTVSASGAAGVDAYIHMYATYSTNGLAAGLELDAKISDGVPIASLYSVQGNVEVEAQLGTVKVISDSILLGNTRPIKISKNWSNSANATTSEIANDTSGTFNQLMLIGNSFSGVARRVGVWDQLQIGGSAFYQTFNVSGTSFFSGAVGIGLSSTSPNGLHVTTPVTETASGFANVRLGTLTSPRVIFEYGSGSSQWELDNNAGEFRIFTPGQVRMSINSSGLVSINGATYDQVFNVQGGIKTAGSGSIFIFTDRTGTSPTSWGWYATGGVARLWNNVNGDVMQVFSNFIYYSGQLGNGWNTASLGATWAHYGGAYGNVSYRSFGDQVAFTGLAKPSANATAAQTVFTLPVGYRPARQILLNVMSSAGACRIDVDTSGNVIIVGTTFNSTSQWISFNGVVFFTT